LDSSLIPASSEKAGKVAMSGQILSISLIFSGRSTKNVAHRPIL
jgi:hypothetical protein